MLPRLKDFNSKDYLNFCSAIDQSVVFHRKQWEFWAIARTIEKHVSLKGSRGLGFGCGDEPLPFYFIKQGASILATDLSKKDPRVKGWLRHRKHISELPEAKHVSISYIDMSNIPADLKDYDFVWSACSLEHLGSLSQGIEFIFNSLNCLKKGGVAVHTTEFNIKSNTKTIETGKSVFFREKDMEEISKRCRRQGYTFQPLSYEQDEGVHVVERPPPKYRKNFLELGKWLNSKDYEDAFRQHINIKLKGFEVTSILFTILK